MRILLNLIAGVLMISTGMISLGHAGAVLRTESQTPVAKADARKAWPTFFAEFRSAVSKRDRDALTKMMTKDFNGPPHTPEDAFKQWDNPKVGGWLKLRQVLAQGAVFMGPADEGDPEQERATMISPPAAERSKRYRGWWAAFEFQENGKWYCIQFTRS